MKKEIKPLTFEHENEYFERGFKFVCGTDEAGRGPLAGPVVAAACILDPDNIPEGLNDSKKLSEKKREALFDEICKSALAFAIAEASPAEIDNINILNASLLAMRRAVDMMKIRPEVVLIDGNICRGFEGFEAKAIIGGDAKSPSIAAASILAKVTRDRYCLEMDKLYPMYEFAKHKGYPTKLHMELVREYGPCPLHRRTFLKFLDKE